MNMIASKLVAERVVDNPYVTDAEGEARPGNLKITVTERVTTRIGGLAHISPWNRKSGEESKGRRLPHHERAAERFLSLYELAYGGISPALDPERIRVDTSHTGYDGRMVANEDAAREMWLLERGIPPKPPFFAESDFKLLVAVLFYGYAISHITGKEGRALETEVIRFLSLLDRLAERWGSAAGAA